MSACLRELEDLFARMTRAEWQKRLHKQDGHWDVVQQVGELKDDPQVIANEYLQEVDYGDGRKMRMVSVQMQFDGRALKARPAPEVGEHSDQVLAELGSMKMRSPILRPRSSCFEPARIACFGSALRRDLEVALQVSQNARSCPTISPDGFVVSEIVPAYSHVVRNSR